MFLKTASGSSASKASTSETSSAKSASTSTVATKKSSSHSAYERPSSSGAFVIFISRPFFPSEDMSAISAFIYYFFSLCSVTSVYNFGRKTLQFVFFAMGAACFTPVCIQSDANKSSENHKKMIMNSKGSFSLLSLPIFSMEPSGSRLRPVFLLPFRRSSYCP